MLLLRLWNYLRGYVIILVEGYFLEKFINICIHRQIFLWDINRGKDCSLTLKVSIKGFKLLRPVAKKTKCRVSIVKKCGFPFALSKYKRRKTFVVGAFAFVFLLYFFTSFVWVVEVTGNNKIESQIIIDKLAEYGATPGAFKFKIDVNEMVKNTMLEIKELAWVGITVKGTKVKVRVVERVKPPQLIPKDEPCNVVAYRDGVIKAVYTKIGQKVVNAGDTVVNGQLLISGTITSENEEIEPKLVHATGQVMARTWYEKRVHVDDKMYDRVRTGNKKNKYTLILFSNPIRLFKKDVSFENYDKVHMKKRLAIGDDIVLPFELVVDRYYEENIIEKKLTIEEAKKNATQKALKEVEEEIPSDAEVVKREVDFIENEDGSLELSIVVECLEDIGVTEEIGGS